MNQREDDHEMVVYDLADWNDQRRRAIEFLLNGAEIAHEWIEGELQVPRAHQDDVDWMVDQLDEDDVYDDGDDTRTPTVRDLPTDEVEVIADPWRRFAGAIVDYFVLQVSVFGVFAVFLAWTDHHESVRKVAWATALFAYLYVIVPTAVWGRTLGKYVVGTRVVLAEDGRVPGWSRSIARWGMVALPPGIVTLTLPRWSFPVYLVWSIVVYIPILYDPWRRGLHDRVAGTVVVTHRVPA
jgi:uncharacterized RDD family membrane protein YckC